MALVANFFGLFVVPVGEASENSPHEEKSEESYEGEDYVQCVDHSIFLLTHLEFDIEVGRGVEEADDSFEKKPLV